MKVIPNLNTLAVRKNSPNVGAIIKQLMQENGINEAELVRLTGLPQSTINRLLVGGTVDPRSSTLRAIATLFGISIGQLLGDEPLGHHRINDANNNRSSWLNVPIIEWDQALSWIFQKNTFTLYTHRKWVTTERPISQNSFALETKPFMEPRFRKSAINIIDVDAKYKDSHFVLVALNDRDVTVRQIIFDNNCAYLKNFDSTLPTIKLDNNHRILGTIVESRVDLY